MKPRTKLQKMVVEYAKRLSPLSIFQKREAIKRCTPHIGKYNSKGEYTCLDCAHTWKGDYSEKAVCPNCGALLEVNKDRKRKYSDSNYFNVITRYNDMQVIRVFWIQTSLRKGKVKDTWITEVFQRWINSEGKSTIFSVTRISFGWYYDRWNFCSKMEIRQEHPDAHDVCGTTVGRSSFIPLVIRNGFDGDFHGVSPHKVLPMLIKDHKFETLWKTGQFELADYYSRYRPVVGAVWDKVRIAIRHGYVISDFSMWDDMISCLEYLGKDTHNPKYICPKNLKEAHDHWVLKRREREDEVRRRKLINDYNLDPELNTIWENRYRNEKGKFFGLAISDDNLVIKPLMSVKEFINEGETLHHCVFVNKYYQKSGSLILHALVDGTSIATIELNLDNMSIMQCRGKHNSKPEQYDKIVGLIKSNIKQIAKLKSA